MALATDHCFSIGLHRIEINIRPENMASRRVVEKLGFRPEGLRPRYLHIDGDWRDHLSFALTVDEVRKYYRSDARTWEVLLRLRRADQWWQRRVRRQSYPFLLPERTER